MQLDTIMPSPLQHPVRPVNQKMKPTPGRGISHMISINNVRSYPPERDTDGEVQAVTPPLKSG